MSFSIKSDFKCINEELKKPLESGVLLSETLILDVGEKYKHGILITTSVHPFKILE